MCEEDVESIGTPLVHPLVVLSVQDAGTSPNFMNHSLRLSKQ